MEFINKLSFEKLRTVLNNCGLFVVDDEEYFNEIKAQEKNGELECYYFRAIDFKRGLDENQLIKDKISKKIIDNFSNNVEFDKNLLNFSYSNDNKIDIFLVSDFMFTRAFPVEYFGDEFPNKRDLELQKELSQLWQTPLKTKIIKTNMMNLLAMHLLKKTKFQKTNKPKDSNLRSKRKAQALKLSFFMSKFIHLPKFQNI